MGSLLISSISANVDILTANSATWFIVNGTLYTYSEVPYTGDYILKDLHWGKSCWITAWTTHYNAHPWTCMRPANSKWSFGYQMTEPQTIASVFVY